MAVSVDEFPTTKYVEKEREEKEETERRVKEEGQLLPHFEEGKRKTSYEETVTLSASSKPRGIGRE